MSTTIAGGAVGDLADPAGEPNREATMQAFLAGPLFPEPTALTIYHITTLLALAAGGPTQQAAIHLFN